MNLQAGEGKWSPSHPPWAAMGTADREGIIPLCHRPLRGDATFDDTEKQAEGEIAGPRVELGIVSGMQGRPDALSASGVRKRQTHSLW